MARRISIDEKVLYVGDTESEYLYAFDVQSDGRVTNKRPFAKLLEPEKGSLGLRSRADGMALDSMGRVYVSTAAGIQVIDPRGTHLGSSLSLHAPAFGSDSTRGALRARAR
jgi:gluconolactonase